METPYQKELETRRSAVKFENRRLEAEYRTYVSYRSELNVRRQLGLGAITLIGATALDAVFLPGELALRAALIRAGFALPPMIVAFALTYVRRALWLRQAAGIAVALAFGLTSLLIGDLASASQYAAFAGGFIVVVFAYFFLGLHYVNAVIAGFALVAAYVPLAVVDGTPSMAIVYTAYNLLVLNVICAIGAGQLELARRRDFLKERLLVHRSTNDALSGVANRATFDRHLAETWEQAEQTRAPLALMLIDIDHFKAYNDNYGHQAGDRAIQRVGAALKRALQRPQDFAARYGGEEFAAVVLGIEEEPALKLAERVRQEVLHENMEHAYSTAGDRVSVSIGVAHLVPWQSDRSPRGFVQIADQALYAAKEAGRNRVVSASAISTAATGMFAVGVPRPAP
jgi:diguanylate cyclase (GGDEF)-like protein